QAHRLPNGTPSHSLRPRWRCPTRADPADAKSTFSQGVVSAFRIRSGMASAVIVPPEDGFRQRVYTPEDGVRGVFCSGTVDGPVALANIRSPASHRFAFSLTDP